MSAETNSSEEMVDTEENLTPEEEAATEAANPTAQLEQLQAQLAVEQKKAADNLEGWQRARADYENLKRRTQTERANLSVEARERILVKLLPAVDDFERALQNVPENLKSEPWISGVGMIEKKLKTLLEGENVAEIPAQGAEFNPHLHEAVQRDEDGDGEKDVVTAVYQKGYKLGDKVIRAAVVKVGRE